MDEEENITTLLGIRRTAVIETLVFLFTLTALNFLFGSGQRFVGVSPHPFWAIILLVTVQYGTKEGLFAAICSIVFLYCGNLPEITFNQTLFDYRIQLFKLPALWIVSATILGEMRQRVDFDKKRYQESTKTALAEAETIASAYEQLKEKKDQVEMRLAGQMNTLATAYNSLKDLESLNPAQIFISLKNFVKQSIRPNKFSIYAFNDSGFESVICDGWSSEDRYKTRFSAEHPLSKRLLTAKRMVCIINSEDEKVLEGEGIVATPIIDKHTGEVFGMMKIEKMPFAEMNLSNLEACETLSELIGTTFANARRYQVFEQSSIYYDQEEKIYSRSLYQVQKQLLSNVIELSGISCAMIAIHYSGKKRVPSSVLKKCQNVGFFAAKTELPKGGLVFSGGKNDLQVLLLLPGVEVKDAKKLAIFISKEMENSVDIDDFELDVDVQKLGALKSCD